MKGPFDCPGLRSMEKHSITQRKFPKYGKDEFPLLKSMHPIKGIFEYRDRLSRPGYFDRPFQKIQFDIGEICNFTLGFDLRVARELETLLS